MSIAYQIEAEMPKPVYFGHAQSLWLPCMRQQSTAEADHEGADSWRLPAEHTPHS